MLRIKVMRAEDIPFGVSVTDQENWGVTRRDLQRLMQVSPRGCFIALDGPRKVGMTTTTSYGRQLAWIGNVIVRPDQRGRSIGRKLVQHAVSYLQKTRVRTIALYCFDERVRFYGNLGFVKDESFVRLRRDPRKGRRDRTDVPAMPPSSLSKVLHGDREAFGADRSKLIRMFLDEGTGRILCSTRNPQGASYLLIKESETECEIGPWVCEHPAPGEPEEMMDHALVEVGSMPVEASCVKRNRKAMHTFESRDFQVIRSGYRMLYDERAVPGNDSSQYALGFLDKG